MLDIKKLLTKILKKLKFTPTLLHNTKVACSSVGTSYSYTTISNLSNWNIVLVYFVVHEQAKLIWFVRGLQVDTSIVATPPSGYFRGTLIVDWTNNRIGMRCINAGTNNTYPNLIYFQGVWGIA